MSRSRTMVSSSWYVICPPPDRPSRTWGTPRPDAQPKRSRRPPNPPMAHQRSVDRLLLPVHSVLLRRGILGQVLASQVSSRSTCAPSPSSTSGCSAWRPSCATRSRAGACPGGRGDPGAARGRPHGRRHRGGRAGRPHAVRHPRQLMSSLGLTPSEYSSGERRRQGGITKAGNTHAPRALVAGACLSVPGQGQPASATPAGEAAGGGTGHRREGAGAAGPTVSAVERPREARQPGRGGHGREMAAL